MTGRDKKTGWDIPPRPVLVSRYLPFKPCYFSVGTILRTQHLKPHHNNLLLPYDLCFGEAPRRNFAQDDLYYYYSSGRPTTLILHLKPSYHKRNKPVLGLQLVRYGVPIITGVYTKCKLYYSSHRAAHGSAAEDSQKGSSVSTVNK